MYLSKLLLGICFVGLSNSAYAYNSPRYTHDLAKDNYKLVPYFAKPFIKKHKLSKFNSEELIQEGYIGLIYACRKYDNTMKIAISTYSSYWIKSYMNKYIKKIRKIPHPYEFDQSRYMDYDYESIIDLDVLDPLEQDFVRKRYYERMKMKDIAKHFNMPKHRLTKYSKKILEKLRLNIEKSE
ncbi:MAG: hypothetical protein CMH58_10460 [Myxococcales bacterium]|nr:hypothetical protein [Myxococcales bacterium]